MVRLRALQLIITAYRAGRLTAAGAKALVGRLVDAEACFPAAARIDLLEWARTRNPPLM